MKYPAHKPCPIPGEMIVVKTKEGSYWRMKRKKGTTMNPAMTGTQDMLKILSPAAARFVGEIRPYLSGLKPGRITVRVKSCLHQSVANTGGLDYQYMQNLNFQPDYPLWKLMQHVPDLDHDGPDVVLHIPIYGGGAVKALNSAISGYRLALIMIVGDPIKGETLNSFETISSFYERGLNVEDGCTLRLIRPNSGERWVCMLRIVSYEDSQVANNPRHAGMKVVGWG